MRTTNLLMILVAATGCVGGTTEQSGAGDSEELRTNITITQQPLSTTLHVGDTLALSVNASSHLTPLSYQWRKDGTNLSGQTSSYLTIASVQLSDTGSYTVLIRNARQQKISNAAQVTVLSTAAPPDMAAPNDMQS